MTAALFSVQWYRVARVRPRLRSQVRVRRQQWRGQHWFLMSDESTGRQHRINEAGYQIIGRCDGSRTVHEIWQAVLEAAPDDAPSQDEVLQLLGQLNELELLQSDRPADVESVQQRRLELEKKRRRSMLNPFAFRLPLGDPASWLNRLDPLARALFNPWIGLLWLLAMVVTGLAAMADAPALGSHASQHLFTTTSLAMIWLVYPVMKAIHEMAHALAVRRWGGEVHEMGIGLLLLVPAPYVDASAASAFPKRTQRAMVGAAGIVAELAMAAIGFWVWSATQPGFVNQLAFGVAVMGTVSSLLFNGNPLLRFDAYHVLCDLADLPNLGARSGHWWMQRLGRWLLGARIEPPAHARSERAWLWTYAPLSLAYRVVLSVAVVLWLGSQWLLLALAALGFFLFTVVLKPLVTWGRQSIASVQPGRELARVKLRMGLLVAVSSLAVFVVPLPYATVAPGVVWLPDEAQVRPEVDGFIKAWAVRDGQPVAAGDLLLTLSNPELLSQREQTASRLEGLQAEQVNHWLGDTPAAQNLALDIQRVQAELARLDERIAQLQVRAGVAGQLVMPRQADLLGSYWRQGQLLGHVLAPEVLRVRAAVPEADAFVVQSRLVAAEVRLADARHRVLRADRVGGTPAATRQLPSPALAVAGGGPYDVDASQQDGLLALEPVVLVDLTLPGHTMARVGGRAWVRFDHGSEPLAVQLYRRSAQLFLKHFSASA
jgi:putative peptide zinc metalloprotease protein